MDLVTLVEVKILVKYQELQINENQTHYFANLFKY